MGRNEANDTRPRTPDKLTPEIIRAEIQKHGVHTVAEWSTGGSDANDLMIHRRRPHQRIPMVSKETATKFMNGELTASKATTTQTTHQPNQKKSK